jgi:hypothetical protein
MTLIDEAKAMRREQIEVNHAVMDGEPFAAHAFGRTGVAQVRRRKVH